MRLLLSITLLSGFMICLTYQQNVSDCVKNTTDICTDTIIVVSENTVESRFPIPDGFRRKNQASSSFASYLLSLKLKHFSEPVLYYDGRAKANPSIYCAVIDMDIDALDLQQCADAIMRLRAEYLYEQARYSEIKFNFLSDGKPRYYEDYAKGNYSYKLFRKYLRNIFSYANTSSLHDELVAINQASEIEAGDVFIQKGRPYGHAIIVVDVIESMDSEEKKFMLAQSYMPAQETQVLLNPSSSEPTPWYSTKSDRIITPEWTFEWKDLRRFEIVRP